MAENFVIEKYVVRTLVKAIGVMALVAAVAYPVDFAIWRARVAMSHDGRGGMGTVTVNRVVAAELKGNKEDYYFDGTAVMDCSCSLYPQGGNGACWWMRRHPDIITRY